MKKKELRERICELESQLRYCRKMRQELVIELNTRKMQISKMSGEEKDLQKKAVVQQQPTRPSEDDMMSKPQIHVSNPTNDNWVKEKFVDEAPLIPEDGGPVGRCKTRPNVRDIGLRVDRHGNVVFKPELAE